MCENNIEKQLEEFNDKMITMRNVDGLLRNVKPYLGTIDAEKEWNDNPEDAYRRFLHTKSYCDFLDENALILLGRTGTGKTSILRCICENVNLKRSDTYDFAVMVQFGEILENLINEVDNFNNQIVNMQLIKIVSMYINIYVMKTLIKYNESIDSTSAMYSYIKNNHLYELGEEIYSHSGVNRLQKMLKAAAKLKGKAGEVASDVVTVMDIAEAFLQNGYDEAYIEMVNILRNKKVLVLIDTLNEYDLRDVRVVVCIKALIATCFEYYNQVATRHIYVKISIPSEIHTHLIEYLPGKQQGNTVVIQWKKNDLIKMIAIRLLDCCKNDNTGILKFQSKYTYDDFRDDNPSSASNARKLLHEILPDTCPTSLEYTLNTLTYCIRHTLKKPRELMTIFNYFITRIYEEKDMKFFINNPDEIRKMVHSTQEEMISSALSMYTTSYKDILEACEIVLQGRKYYFQGRELDDKLKEAAVNKQGYDINDIKRILLESGLVGKINEITKKCVTDDEESKKKNLTVENCIQLIKAKFEYQVKGRLSLNKQDYYVIHPMCYEHFECKVGNQSLVYPSEFEDDAEVMKSVRLKK